MRRRGFAPARTGFPAAALLAAALAAAGLLGGCSRLGDYGALIRGNRLHERGRYQEAAAAYLSARPFAFGPVLDYDLANVYARLGELDAAAELYAGARKAGDPSLSAAAFYNEGLALYEKARFEESYRAFRASLALDPGDEEARRNLEIAYRDWRKSDLAPPERAAPSSRSRGDGDEELRLLRRLETGRYKPGAASDGAARLEDY